MTTTANPLTFRASHSRSTAILYELATNSGHFWVFDTMRFISVDGVKPYFTLPHLLLFLSSLVQAWFLSNPNYQYKRSTPLGNFIAPVLYSISDSILEGPGEFLDEPYHLLFWGFAIAMTLADVVKKYYPGASALASGVTRTMLLPAMYMLSEWETLPEATTVYDYWLNIPGHMFILFAALLFGILLGAAQIVRDRFEDTLRRLTAYLEQVTNWAFDSDLVIDSFADSSQLSLQRVERTVLFMDIRGFTAWSEKNDPAEVVRMLNRYYAEAEKIIEVHGGFKIQLTGDEVMTRFQTTEQGVQAALALREPIQTLLKPYNLGAGIGVHTGELIEGLIGSEKTRQYGIIGDSVNTAARLQSAAASGEIIISDDTRQRYPGELRIQDKRSITAKGKSEPLQVYCLG